jgi:hypothetical protein
MCTLSHVQHLEAPHPLGQCVLHIQCAFVDCGVVEVGDQAVQSNSST